MARASIALGAGRERKGEPIDLAVGVVLQAKLGDRVSRGQPIAMLHANDEARLVEAERVLRTAVALSRTPVEPPPVILERLATTSSAVKLASGLSHSPTSTQARAAGPCLTEHPGNERTKTCP